MLVALTIGKLNLAIPRTYYNLLVKYALFGNSGWIVPFNETTLWLSLPGVFIVKAIAFTKETA